MNIINYIFFALAVLIFIPTFVFAIECLVGLWAVKFGQSRLVNNEAIRDENVVILIPAHNEQDVIQTTLDSISPQLKSADRIVVIADNCQDSTADIVRKSGHIVHERFDSQHRGKGFALAYGLATLNDTPPDMVIILDADCTIEAGCIDTLIKATRDSNKPVQGCYLMYACSDSTIKSKISQFAIFVKNHIRMYGNNHINGVVPLLGSGMSFPWDVVKNMNFSTGEIAEDMYLGLNLIIENKGCIYEPNAKINSPLPEDSTTQKGQRERWEHGHLDLIRRFFPLLLIEGVKQRRIGLWFVLADLSVPPLALLVLLQMFLLVVTSLSAFIGGGGLAFLVTLISLGGLSSVIGLVWWTSARTIMSVKDFLSIPAYIMSKISIYIGFIFNKQTSWIKTKRR